MPPLYGFHNPQNKTPSCSLSPSDVDRWPQVPVSVIVDLDPGLRQINPAIALLQSSVQMDGQTIPASDSTTKPILFGHAITARCEPPDFCAVLHVIDHVGKGDVLVMAANGVSSHAMIGDVLGGHLRTKGAVGCVCDGAVRDTNTLAGWYDFPMYCHAVTPRGPVGSAFGAVNKPVMVAGCEIRPGDLVIGDSDGMVVLSKYDLCNWISAAEAQLKQGTGWARRLENVETVSAVFQL